MSRPKSRRSRTLARQRTLAIAAAALVHVLLLSSLAVRLTPPQVFEPAIEVQLVRSPPPHHHEQTQPSPIHQPRRPSPETPRPIIFPTTATPTPSPVVKTAPVLTEPAAPSGALSSALRGAVGCVNADLLRLSKEERERCFRQDREAARGGPIYAVEPADPAKAAEFDRLAAKSAAMRRYMEAPMTQAPCLGLWCPPCSGASCPDPLRHPR